jgi:hypothetical protein
MTTNAQDFQNSYKSRLKLKRNSHPKGNVPDNKSSALYKNDPAEPQL